MRVEDKNLNEIRFRSNVYKMLSEPGKSAPYAIPDTKFDNFSERESEEKVATSIILRLMEESRFSMKPSVLIGKSQQNMLISQRKVQSMQCWRTSIVRLISTWIYINKTLFLLSIDYAVMEKSKEIYTLPAEFGWSDLGSWGSLRTLLPQDEAGNAKVGKDICLYECKNCVVHAADESKVVVQGLDGYIVAEKNGQLLVCSLKEEQRIKEFGK